MSMFHTCEIDLNDETCLIEALKEMGYKPRVSEIGEVLKGIYGSEISQGKCHVICDRKSGVGSAFGFERTGKTFKMHSQMGHINVERMKQLHAKHKLMRQVNSSGRFAVESVVENDKKEIKMRLVRLS